MNYSNQLQKNALAIFLFHGIIKKSAYSIRNYTRKHIEADYFYSIIKELKRTGNPLSMSDIVRIKNHEKSYPPFSFAITFDDGFENNYSIAAPILKDLNVPAIFYLSTNWVSNNLMSWADQIEYCFERMNSGVLNLPWDKCQHHFNTVEEKIKLLDYIRINVKKDSTINKKAFISDFFAQCGIPETYSSDDPLDMKMTWNQVKILCNDSLFIIGGHTHNHSIMTYLSPSALQIEIINSIKLIKKHTGLETVKHYSYPVGLEFCYSENVISILKENGIICCPTAIDGINPINIDLFHLKRIAVV